MWVLLCFSSACISLSIYVTNMDFVPWFFIYFIVVDVFNQINAYCLILLCKDVRVHLGKFLGIEKVQNAPQQKNRPKRQGNQDRERGQNEQNGGPEDGDTDIAMAPLQGVSVNPKLNQVGHWQNSLPGQANSVVP